MLTRQESMSSENVQSTASKEISITFQKKLEGNPNESQKKPEGISKETQCSPRTKSNLSADKQCSYEADSKEVRRKPERNSKETRRNLKPTRKLSRVNSMPLSFGSKIPVRLLLHYSVKKTAASRRLRLKPGNFEKPYTNKS